MKLVECVPNFSEGRNKTIIREISYAVESVSGVKLLNVDPGKDTNRTVVTFVGTPEAVKEAAFQAIKAASDLIDMTKHQGAHPRMGATDVCPIIPVSDVTMEECIELSNQIAERVGRELQIPIYMYEYSAKKPERRNLANIREGEYEGFAEKMKDPKWAPDYGPSEFNARTGATVIGVRDFLIAYNVNLNTRDEKLAKVIANNIREKGKPKKGADGKALKNEKGETVYEPGILKECKAIGWYIDDYKIAQISINLTNYKVTPPHIAFDTAAEEAAKLGLRVTGSELVGLLPKEAILMAGKHYLRKQGRNAGVPERELIHIAVKSMGLDELAEFNPDEKILEYAYSKDIREKQLVNKTIYDFCDELSADSPAPGGGSVAGLNAALGASLISMVANLTYLKKGYEDVWKDVERIAEEAQILKRKTLQLIDDDTDAFNVYMAALKMPKKSDSEKAERDIAILSAIKKAAEVPLGLMEVVGQSLVLLVETVSKGNKNSISDIGVAAINMFAAAESAYMNVLINLQNISDTDYKAEKLAKANSILLNVKETAEKVKAEVYKIIG